MKNARHTSLLDRANEQIDRNKTAGIGLLVLILVVFGGYTTYTNFQQKHEDKAQSEYFEAERLFAANQGAKEFTEDKKAKTAPAVNVDTTQVEQKLNDVIIEYPKTKAAIQAAMMMADIQVEKKDTAKAIAVLENSFKNYSGELIDSMMALKLSSLYEQNKQCDKALPVLDKVYNAEVTELKPEALLRKALCEESLGNADQAKLSYQKLATEFSDTNQGQQAQKYLKIM